MNTPRWSSGPLRHVETQSRAKRFAYTYGGVIGLLLATALWGMDRLHLPSWEQWAVGIVSALVFGLLLRQHFNSRPSKT
jgi:hypothetical protein